MPVTPKSAPNLSRLGTFDPKKGYTKAILQQGVPIMDVDWNDGFDFLHHLHNQGIRNLHGYLETRTKMHEWAFRPVSFAGTPTGETPANRDNFGITLGRLLTRLGVVDTSAHEDSALDAYIVYDWQKIVDEAASLPNGRQYANRMFYGKITQAGVGETTEVHDENKSWSANHRLTATSQSVVIPGGPAGVSPEPTATINDFEMNISEPACRVVVATGPNAGEVREISAVLAGNQLQVSSAFSNPFQLGDEYYIIPGNSLTAARAAYDAITTSAGSSWRGLSNHSAQVIVAQCFEDTVSGDEDASLVDVRIDRDTSHRTALRWCIRVLNVKTSIDTDPSRSSWKPVHFKNALSLHGATGVGSERHLDLLNDGTVAAGDQNDGSALVQSFAQGQSGGGLVQSGSDFGFEYEHGISRYHHYAYQGNHYRMTEPDVLWPFLQACLSIGLISPTLTPTTYAPLYFMGVEGKTSTSPATETLNEYVFPNLYQDGSSPYVHGWMYTNQAHLDSYATDVAERAVLLTPPVAFHSPAQLSRDMMQAMGFGFNIPAADSVFRAAQNANSGLLHETSSGVKVPLLYSSLGERLSAMETLLVGLSGLGHQLGQTVNSLSSPSPAEIPRRIPSSKNYVPSSETQSMFQAGQSNATWNWDETKMLNPMSEARGALSSLDPLVGADGGLDIQSSLGKFSTGPAQYITKGGTVIDVDDDGGWSHFRHQSNFLGGATNETDLSVRKFQDGKAQAALMRDALNFRKLAIKTVAHREAELFNYWIGRPSEVSDNSTLGAVKDFLQPDGYGYSSIGALRSSYDQQGRTTKTPDNRDSYRLGLMDGTTPVNQNALINTGFAVGNPSSGLKGSASIEYYDHSGPGLANLAVRPSDDVGPWGRFNIDGVESSHMADQWENRCTALRLRYHIGDFYPGPDNGETPSQKVNALVDTLNLFVKIEPLSLVHWATMPKHQHQMIQNTVSFLDAIKLWSNLTTGLGSTAHLLAFDGSPKITTSSPEYTGANEGASDFNNNPFPHKHQPFVHWYHPMMELITGPHPSGSEYSGTSPSAYNFGKKVAYRKWGERSLVIPGITFTKMLNMKTDTPDRGDGGDTGSGIENWGHDSSGTDLQNIGGGAERLDAETRHGGTATRDLQISQLGTHRNDYDERYSVGSPGTDGIVVSPDGTNIVTEWDRVGFPFVPNQAENGNPPTFTPQLGHPGPVFIPAFRNFLKGQDTGPGGGIEPSAFGAIQEKFGFHEVFAYTDNTIYGTQGAQGTATSGGDGEAQYWPRRDLLNHQGPNDWFTSPSGNGAPGFGGSVGGPKNPDSVYDWALPVLRAHLRTDTVAAVVDLVRTTFSFDDTQYGATSPQAGTGPDWNTDQMFCGDLGTSVMMDPGGNYNRIFYMNPLCFGVPYKDADAGSEEIGTAAFNDIFEASYKERLAGSVGAFGPSFVPLLNTFKYMQYLGLQQKLLLNSSLRVLHTRPGGGFQPGKGTAQQVSANPKSLTELFLVRNRQTGTAVSWPRPPETPQDKPFIHLESIHPVAAGGGPYTTHPNHAYVGHLYPMIADAMGANTLSSPNSLADDAPTSTSISGPTYNNAELSTGLTGDTHVGDPFDREWSRAAATAAVHPLRIPQRDRNHQNSGLEIDLVSELRYVRENPGAHGLNTVASNGLKLLDMMPTVEDLTAPGDHEIVFVLYTGKYGQKMVDNTVPDGYNPPVCGCKVIASIEVNRPNEKLASDGSGDGEHHGEQFNTYHILGHQ